MTDYPHPYQRLYHKLLRRHVLFTVALGASLLIMVLRVNEQSSLIDEQSSLIDRQSEALTNSQQALKNLMEADARLQSACARINDPPLLSDSPIGSVCHYDGDLLVCE
jgi:hypothetical protein